MPTEGRVCHRQHLRPDWQSSRRFENQGELLTKTGAALVLATTNLSECHLILADGESFSN